MSRCKNFGSDDGSQRFADEKILGDILFAGHGGGTDCSDLVGGVAVLIAPQSKMFGVKI